MSLIGGVLGKQTWSRYIVETYLKHYKWYNPNRDNPEAPSLSNGWAYFEHFTLPRRFRNKVGGHHIRAPPGSGHDTKLYSVLTMPVEALVGRSELLYSTLFLNFPKQDLNSNPIRCCAYTLRHNNHTHKPDWGIGMSMYFSSLIAVCVIFILAGLINVANMLYYVSDKYDANDERYADVGTMKTLFFSAICTDREWVLCSEGCEGNKWWNTIFANQYYGTATNSDGKEVVLINRTTCLPAEFQQGMINYGSTLFLLLCMSLYFWYLGMKEVRFDEDDTTATDYTVVVSNPPADAVNPDEWRDFFDKFSDKGVTLCTVALDNELLLTKLVARRMQIKNLQRQFLKSVEDVNYDVEEDVSAAVDMARRYRLQEEAVRNCFSKFFGYIFTPLCQRLGFSLTEDIIWERIKSITEEIRELQHQEYKATSVFVTFETQEGQRSALTALNASELEIATNTAQHISSNALFCGRVLRVEEASDPNAVVRVLEPLWCTCDLLMIAHSYVFL